MEQSAQKGKFRSNAEKLSNTIEFCILELETKFKNNLTILVFRNKLAEIGYSRSKTEHVSITIEFCIFELVLSTKFQLKLAILIFWTKFTRKSISGLKPQK